MALDRYKSDPYWKGKRLTPAQILVHDVKYEALRSGQEPRLEIQEILSSSLVPETGRESAGSADGAYEKGIESYASTRREHERLKTIQVEYGWMNSLRQPDTAEDAYQCRWIHISSKFPEYLQGVFVALSDWTSNLDARIDGLRQLDRCIYENERFSKHGRYFSPFFQCFASPSQTVPEDDPILISLPFIDWTVNPGPTPPLRFQIDPREGYYSTRSQSHLLRSILQHYYRLEDTSDRERDQVFTKHKPWSNNREIDLKVRRWYGRYPTGLNVDELWILVVDSRHIVTFSSNQSWKSRWPPLQMPYRVAEVSFRSIRNNFFNAERKQEYMATTHAIACLHGAIGMIHRSFWSDVPLCLTDRYGGYLGHLQYRLHRSPNAKLVMDLLQVQEELNIVYQITGKQEDIVMELQQHLNSLIDRESAVASRRKSMSSSRSIRYQDGPPPDFDDQLAFDVQNRPPRRSNFRPDRYGHRFVPDPMTELLDHVRRELDDLRELRDNSSELLNRTVQLVNIRLEDHGQAILVFTIVTIIFLPLSFVSSFFGMNVSDIRKTAATQGTFWIAALILTAGVVGGAIFLAFYGRKMMEGFLLWKEHHPFRRKPKTITQARPILSKQGFNVLGVSHSSGGL